MEFAAAALSSLADAGTAAAGAVSSAASGIGGAVSSATSAFGGAGSFFSGILQGVGGITSAMAATRAAQAKADAYQNQAADAERDANQQQIAATGRQTGLRKDLLATLGQRDVAYAASGLDLSFGTPVQARDQAIVDSSNAIAGDQATADTNQAMLRQRAAQYRKMAGQALDAGDYTAIGTALSTAGSILKRG
jgi:hypothetical protein